MVRITTESGQADGNHDKHILKSGSGPLAGSEPERVSQCMLPGPISKNPKFK